MEKLLDPVTIALIAGAILAVVTGLKQAVGKVRELLQKKYEDSPWNSRLKSVYKVLSIAATVVEKVLEFATANDKN